MATPLKPTKKETEMRASLGFVKDYYLRPSTTSMRHTLDPTREEYNASLDIYKQDAIISGAIDTVGEESVRNGGYFIGPENKVKKAEELFRKLDFYTKAEIDVKTQHLYGDSFVEMRFDDKTGELKELHNLETTEMWILYNAHGDIIGYEQNQWDIRGGAPEILKLIARWDPEQIIFTPLKPLGSRVHSYNPLEPAMRSLVTRTYAHYFLQTVFQNFRPQLFLSIDNNVSSKQVQALTSAIKAADKDPSKKILSVGKVDVQTGGMYEFKKDLVDILNYFRQEILSTTKVPGIYVGITADSNRGIGEFEANAFMAHLIKVHRGLEKMGQRILDAANIKGVTFKMRPPSIKSQTDVIDQAKKLRDMGYGDDIITPFLFNNGIPVPHDAKFQQENKISMDDYESRQGSGKGVTEGKYNLDENGRSDDGKAKSADMDKKLRAALTELSR